MSTWRLWQLKVNVIYWPLSKVTQIQYFQTSFPQKSLGHLKPNFIWSRHGMLGYVLGHMNKMASRPIYGKNLHKSPSSEPSGRWPWNLVYTYMPYLTLWDKISQNLAHLEANSHKIIKSHRPSYNTLYEEINRNHTLLFLSHDSYI